MVTYLVPVTSIKGAFYATRAVLSTIMYGVDDLLALTGGAYAGVSPSHDLTYGCNF